MVRLGSIAKLYPDQRIMMEITKADDTAIDGQPECVICEQGETDLYSIMLALVASLIGQLP